MSVHVGEVRSSVDVQGGGDGQAQGQGGGGAPASPGWAERERYRKLCELAERDRLRVAGEGFGA